jgi:hypothetical protein
LSCCCIAATIFSAPSFNSCSRTSCLNQGSRSIVIYKISQESSISVELSRSPRPRLEPKRRVLCTCRIFS